MLTIATFCDVAQLVDGGRVGELGEHRRQRLDRRQEVPAVAGALEPDDQAQPGEHVGPLPADARDVGDLHRVRACEAARQQTQRCRTSSRMQAPSSCVHDRSYRSERADQRPIISRASPLRVACRTVPLCVLVSSMSYSCVLRTVLSARDVLGAADAGEDELLLLLVGLDALAGLEDERAVGLHVEHLGGDAQR